MYVTYLSLGQHSNQPLSILSERHNWGGGTRPLRILDDLWGFPLHDGHTWIGCPQIDANHSTFDLWATEAYSST